MVVARYVPNELYKRKGDPVGFLFVDRELTREEIEPLKEAWKDLSLGYSDSPVHDIEIEP